MRDVYQVFDVRLSRMLAEDHPRFDQLGPGRERPSKAGTASRSSWRSRRSWPTAGGVLADRFDGVAEDQWQRTGERSDGSLFTVESFGKYLLHDPIHHLWDVGDPFEDDTVRR